MQTLLLWCLPVAVCVGLLSPRTRSAGLLALAGAIMSLFIHYDFATIPEARNVATLFWAGAAVLLVANLRAQCGGKTV